MRMRVARKVAKQGGSGRYRDSTFFAAYVKILRRLVGPGRWPRTRGVAIYSPPIRWERAK